MKSANILDRHFNLYSSYLLEASAGTGKTFSIENIVTRLLIEGDEPLELDQILVVTFTRASASDLKARIRENIERTLKILIKNSSEIISHSIYDYILNILEKPKEVTRRAILRLKAALFTFDQAQIFTIHAFCAKMLRTNFLEGNAPCQNVHEDAVLLNTEILKVIRNFFRTGLCPSKFSPNQLKIVLKRHKSNVENLEKALSKIIERGVEIAEDLDFDKSFNQFLSFFKSYAFEKDKIIADFNRQISNFCKLKTSENSFENVLFFASLFEKEEVTKADFDRLILEGIHFFECLHPSLLKSRAKPILESELFYPGLHKLIQTDLLPILNPARSYEMIFAKMAHECKKLFRRYLDEEEKFCFDDLLKMMQNALKNKSFLKGVQERYKVGIIDEFQDTDPIQWKIFKEIFYQSAHLYLVGDPKQSIYAFRQADIYTYLQAANLILPSNRLSLDVNFRSHKPLVDALNALFKKETISEFIELPKLQSVLEYRPVRPNSIKQEVHFEDGLGSVHFLIVEETEKKKIKVESLEELYFPFIFNQIINLKKQLVKLSEIAILVKDNRQAIRVAAYLKKHKIETVLQKNSSIADSVCLQSLIELILALISPKDESVLKTALGNPLIGYLESDILSLQDPFKMEALLAKVYTLQKILFIQGFASFFEAFLKSVWKEMSIAERLLGLEEGLSLYQDVCQIAETLIEYQSQCQASPDKLLRFLQEFKELNFDSDQRLKRLKNISDEAVQVLTIHSSKGLEFEIVFALGLVNKTPGADLLVPIQEEEKTTLVPVCDKKSEIYVQYLQELDAEKSRQLYVALTRAKHRVYIPAAILAEAKEKNDGTASCMDLFLQKFMMINSSLTNWIDKQDVDITYSILNDQIEQTDAVLPKNNVELYAPQSISLKLKPSSMVSFTQLATKGTAKSTQGMPHDFDAVEKNQHQLPSGRETGILLHLILESFPFENYTLIENASELYAFVQPFVLGTKFEPWKEVIADILFNVLHCPLDFFTFKDLNPLNMYREQEFIYPHDHGYIKGLIDLMFLHQGKYYFVDWKSNWLGSSYEDYNQDFLKKAMTEQDYLLQSDIYKEALRRFLKLTEKNNFEDCFGGIFYIFLRGLKLENPDHGVLHFKGKDCLLK